MEHASRIRERDPENFRSYLIIGNIHLALSEFEEARSAYRAVHALHPDIIQPQYYLALTAFLSGRKNEAISLYEQLINKNLYLADAASLYCSLLFNNKRENDAFNFLSDLLNNDNTNVYLHQIIGEMYFLTGNKIKAADSFSLAIKNNSNMKVSYLRLVDIYENNKNKQEEILLRAIEKNHYFKEAYIKLAAHYLTLGLPSKALDTLKKAMSYLPRSAQIANNLAWLYLKYQQDDIDEAMRLAQIAYEGLPNNPAVADTLGWIYYLKKMPTRAIWLLEQAMESDSDNPIINFHLGMALVAERRREEGRQHLALSIKLGINETERVEAEQALKIITNQL
jgi:tetratricopeptide (TPR) repeat protein